VCTSTAAIEYGDIGFDGRIDALTDEAGPVRLALVEDHPKAGALGTASFICCSLCRTEHV
jgi:hypothetical protein